jgi:hypothetical protein
MCYMLLIEASQHFQHRHQAQNYAVLIVVGLLAVVGYLVMF